MLHPRAFFFFNQFGAIIAVSIRCQGLWHIFCSFLIFSPSMLHIKWSMRCWYLPMIIGTCSIPNKGTVGPIFGVRDSIWSWVMELHILLRRYIWNVYDTDGFDCFLFPTDLVLINLLVYNIYSWLDPSIDLFALQRSQLVIEWYWNSLFQHHSLSIARFYHSIDILQYKNDFFDQRWSISRVIDPSISNVWPSLLSLQIFVHQCLPRCTAFIDLSQFSWWIQCGSLAPIALSHSESNRRLSTSEYIFIIVQWWYRELYIRWVICMENHAVWIST